jgi:SAM-dependent methyltransferase
MSNAHGAVSPSAWVRRFVPLIRPRGRVLDLAAGHGRHVTLLRDCGFAVVAADRDTAALAAFAGDPACMIHTLDLEDGAPWALGGAYDGIVVANYLHRPLFPALPAALAPGGVLIYETFAVGNERFGRPSNPEFLLRPGELLAVFGSALTVVAFEEGVVERPKPAVIQRIAAAKGTQPIPLPPAADATPQRVAAPTVGGRE